MSASELPGLGPAALGAVPLFRDAPTAVIEEAEARVATVRWPAGGPRPVALREANTLFVVRAGLVGMMTPSPRGQRLLVAFLGPGMVFSSLGELPPPSAVALSDAWVSVIPEDVFTELAVRHPALVIRLAEALSDRAARYRETIAVLSQRRIDRRLLARISQLAARFGSPTPEGLELRLGLSHAQWALVVGASRSGVTSAFATLRREGVVIVRDGDVILRR